MKILKLNINHIISKYSNNRYVICDNYVTNFPSMCQKESKSSFNNELGTISFIVINYLF